jgi:hypothetical protein
MPDASPATRTGSVASPFRPKKREAMEIPLSRHEIIRDGGTHA